MKKICFNHLKAGTIGQAKAFYKLVCLSAMFLMPFVFGFTPSPVPVTTCPAPANLAKTSEGSGSISYSWSATEGAATYKVKYVRQSDGYESPEYSTSNTGYTFSGLQPGRYSFYFYSLCDEGPSAFIVTEDIIAG